MESQFSINPRDSLHVNYDDVAGHTIPLSSAPMDYSDAIIYNELPMSISPTRIDASLSTINVVTYGMFSLSPKLSKHASTSDISKFKKFLKVAAKMSQVSLNQ